MYSKLKLNLSLLPVVTILLSILSSSNAIAEQNFSYSITSHRLLATHINGNTFNNGSPSNSTAYKYLLGGSSNTVSNSFKSANDPDKTPIDDSNYFNLGPASGVMLSHRDNKANNNELTYSYNDHGIKTIAYNGKQEIEYTHNSFGEVTIIKRTAGYSTFNIYGANGRLDKVIIGSKSANSPAINIKESWCYHYGAGGNLESVTIYSNTAKSHGTITYQYSYNDQNQLTGFRALPQNKSTILNPTDVFGNSIAKRAYHYGLNSNIVSISTSYVNSSNVPMHYYYNIAKGEPNQLHYINTSYPSKLDNNSAAFIAELKAEHGLNKVPYKYNPYGAVKQDPEGNIYNYNNLNQMVTRYTFNGSHQDYGYGTNGLLSYERSNLVKLTGNAPSKEINGKPVFFFYAGGVQPAEQQQGKNNDASSNFYLPGLITFSNHQGNTDLYEVAQGNLVLTSKINKQKQRQINNQYFYTPYGQQKNLYQKITIKPQSPGQDSYTRLINQTLHPLDIAKNQWGYTGQMKDPSSGLMMLGNFRNYAPGIARFIQPDTYNPFRGIYNLYAYVKDNPMLFNDPNGHNPAIDVTEGGKKFLQFGHDNEMFFMGLDRRFAEEFDHHQSAVEAFYMESEKHIRNKIPSSKVITRPPAGMGGANIAAEIVRAIRYCFNGKILERSSEYSQIRYLLSSVRNYLSREDIMPSSESWYNSKNVRISMISIRIDSLSQISAEDEQLDHDHTTKFKVIRRGLFLIPVVNYSIDFKVAGLNRKRPYITFLAPDDMATKYPKTEITIGQLNSLPYRALILSSLDQAYISYL